MIKKVTQKMMMIKFQIKVKKRYDHTIIKDSKSKNIPKSNDVPKLDTNLNITPTKPVEILNKNKTPDFIQNNQDVVVSAPATRGRGRGRGRGGNMGASRGDRSEIPREEEMNLKRKRDVEDGKNLANDIFSSKELDLTTEKYNFMNDEGEFK